MSAERLSSTVRRHDAALAGPVARPALPPAPYLVLGLGNAGLAAARALAGRLGPRAVRAWDAAVDAPQRAAARELGDLGVDIRLGGDGLAALEEIATVVKSPGVPPEAAVAAAAIRRGLPVLDEFEIGRRLVPAPMVGITGTKGKTTTSTLATAVLAADGLAPALVGNTRHGSPLSALAAVSPPRSLVAELSSFQLELATEPPAEAAIFTNLSAEHLSRHGTIESYAAAKRNLFVHGARAVPVAALNADDELGARLADEVEERGGRALRYGHGPEAEHRILACRWDLRRSEIELATPDGPLTVETRMPGPHNAANVAAVLALADGIGLRREPTLAALASASLPPGRFEALEVDAPFDVVNDLGITPVAVAAGIETARAVSAERGARLIVVMCSMSWDAAWQGRHAGRIARAGADHLILSGASYRGEPRLPILAELAAGARSVGGGGLELVIDRRAAIARGLELARPGDVVLLLGRGLVDREATDARGGHVELHDGRVAEELIGA